MMASASSWFGRLRLGLFATPGRSSGRFEDSDTEPVRAAMRAVAQASTGPRGLRLALAIQVAQDLQSLWFLRSALMQAVAAEHGERQARRVLAAVDDRFRALWPDAPVTRPGALG